MEEILETKLDLARTTAIVLLVIARDLTTFFPPGPFLPLTPCLRLTRSTHTHCLLSYGTDHSPLSLICVRFECKVLLDLNTNMHH